MRYLNTFKRTHDYEYEDIIDRFELILKGNKSIYFDGYIDLTNFKLKIPDEFRIINHKKISYYLYKGELFEITTLGNQIEMKISDSDILIKDIEDSIVNYNNRIIEMEDAIQKIRHGGNE
jgi:hypothetical protein